MSTTDFFREPVRYLKESNTQESMMEKPYLEDEYPKMHLGLPDFKFKPKEIPSIFGPIADGDPFPGLAMIDFGDAKCSWRITNVDYCTEGPVIITMKADYLWHAEFEFVAGIAADSIGVSLAQLGPTEASGWDEQDYLLTFPEDANGSVTVCGSASTHTLVSQTFETVVAGMPVGIHLIGGALLPIERGQSKPATLLKSVYGDKGDNCGCITLSSSCGCSCGDETIGFTTKAMSTGESQTLTVVDAVEGCTYRWIITKGAGGLSSPTGTSVTYTAPADNENCTKNPTIVLQIDGKGEFCDTLKIAVNAGGDSVLAYLMKTGCLVTRSGGMCRCTCGLDWTPSGSDNRYEKYSCGGSYLGVDSSYSCSSTDSWSCPPEEAFSVCSAGECDSIIDRRSEAAKAAGCCPAGLL
jgi:hypothetical protein